MPPLYLYIKVQSLQQQKKDYAYYNGEDAHARSKRKSQFDTWNETVQCSQSGQKEPHKAKLFQEAAFRKKVVPHCAHVDHKQASLYGMR